MSEIMINKSIPLSEYISAALFTIEQLEPLPSLDACDQDMNDMAHMILELAGEIQRLNGLSDA